MQSVKIKKKEQSTIRNSKNQEERTINNKEPKTVIVSV